VNAPLGRFNLPSARYFHWHVDLVGPLPVSSGFWYCLTAIDRYTRWPEAAPLSDITAEAVAKAFVSVWVARFGCSQQITTDEGRQFEVRFFKTLATITGSSLTRTTAWHTASNGMVERLHRQLKAALMCHADEYWAKALPLVLLGIRSAWTEDLKASSAELMSGSPLRLPDDFFAPSPAACTDVTDFASRMTVHIGKRRPVPASRHAVPSAFIFKNLATASHVLLRNGALQGALQAPYVGPYWVLHRNGKTYTIEVQGVAKTVSIEHLKPAYVLHDDTASASPPAISSHLTTRSGRRVRFPDYLGVQRSLRGGGCVVNATG
jgi:cleavage and polyadenylation specificity factor subunit 1